MWSKTRRKVRETNPIVHCITNYVTANDCANIILANGGSPVMADEPDEVEDVVELASCLVINIGTLNSSRLEAMIRAGKRANQKNIPVILDPVGAGASAFRKDALRQLLENIRFSVIRANLSEMKVLNDFAATTYGIDAKIDDVISREILDEVVRLAQRLSTRYECTIAISGAVDLISDGNTTYLVYNGVEWMSRITGTGCMLTSLIGSFVGLQDNVIEAVLTGFVMMGLAGELGYQKSLTKSEGYSSMKMYLLDFIAVMDDSHLDNHASYLKYQKLDVSLYGVTDEKIMKNVLQDCRDSLRGGVKMIQLREKSLAQEEFIDRAKALKNICSTYNRPLIINDNLKVMQASGADGIHVGQNDLNCRKVRKVAGANKIIGVTVHNIEEALQAQREGANYLGVGAVEVTTTKKDTVKISRAELAAIARAVVIPVVAIGGLNYDNITKYPGVDGYALVSGIYSSLAIEEKCRKLTRKIEEIKND